MFTFLGAAAETRPEDIGEDLFADAAVVHIEGYLLFNPRPDAWRRVIGRHVRRAPGCPWTWPVSTWWQESRGFLADIVKEYVDILIANEDEARAYTGESEPLPAVQALGREVDIAVLKLGARGQPDRPRRPDRRGAGPPATAAAVDTTGAGDLWAVRLSLRSRGGLPAGKMRRARLGLRLRGLPGGGGQHPGRRVAAGFGMKLLRTPRATALRSDASAVSEATERGCPAQHSRPAADRVPCQSAALRPILRRMTWRQRKRNPAKNF
ncbi:MAG: PfkB family carbohydrate kinase [Desulfobacterales bacterium]|nr:PfkB family carbohydrate kinase [Desulfobacterales bacterium]